MLALRAEHKCELLSLLHWRLLDAGVKVSTDGNGRWMDQLQRRQSARSPSRNWTEYQVAREEGRWARSALRRRRELVPVREHADLLPEHIRSKSLITPPHTVAPMRRRGRPPKNQGDHQAAS